LVTPTNNEMPPPHLQKKGLEKKMDKDKAPLQKIHEEMTKFEKTMEELRLLKHVSQDLKNYRKMIKLKKYD
jgi:hypothetical protein